MQAFCLGLGRAGHTGLRLQEVWEALLMTVLSRLQAAKGQCDKREEIDFLSFILLTAAFSQPAPQTLTVYCGAALALIPEIHTPWL